MFKTKELVLLIATLLLIHSSTSLSQSGKNVCEVIDSCHYQSCQQGTNPGAVHRFYHRFARKKPEHMNYLFVLKL